MMLELVDRRALGAVRFVDVTTRLPIVEPLLVESEDARLIRNRGGMYVLLAARGLRAQTDSFRNPPAQPALASVAVRLTVEDPRRVYLPRATTIRLPRNPAPNAAAASSLFRPIEVAMYPSPAARTAPSWAVIRARVNEAGTERGLPWSLLRVFQDDEAQPLAHGLTDRRGEALVAVPGIPITTFNVGAGPVLATEITVTLQAVHDPALTANDLPDPDLLESRRAELASETLPDQRLASGRESSRRLEVTLD